MFTDFTSLSNKTITYDDTLLISIMDDVAKSINRYPSKLKFYESMLKLIDSEYWEYVGDYHSNFTTFYTVRKDIRLSVTSKINNIHKEMMEGRD